MQLADCEAMLVTQSEYGMTLVPRNGEPIHVPAHPVKVRDVSGAGDTVAAALAVSLAAGAGFENALQVRTGAAAGLGVDQGTPHLAIGGLGRKILQPDFHPVDRKVITGGCGIQY